MPGLNATGLIVIIVATLLAVWRIRRAAVTPRQMLRAGAIAAAYFLVVGVLSTHLCDAGDPVRQFTIPSICLLLILVGVEPAKGRWLAAAIAAAGAVLTIQAVELVHAGYPTNPRYADRQERLMIIRIAAEMRGDSSGRTMATPTTPATTAPKTSTLTPRTGPPPAELLASAIGAERVTASGEVLVPVLRRRWFTNLTGMYEAAMRPKRVLFDGDDWAYDPASSLRLAPSTQPGQ